MKKFIKFSLISLAAIIGILLIAIITLPFIVDPNDYKPQITEVVKEKTGRELSIPGEIELSVFPWLGIKLGEVALSNAPGFGAQPFARIGAVDVRVQLLPLLKKEIRLGRVELVGLQLDLQRDNTGKSNWDDLLRPQPKATKKQVTEETETMEQGLAIAGLAVGGISIRDAQLNWHDQLNNQSITIQSLGLETGSIKADQPVELELTTRFVGKQPAIQGQLSLQTTAQLELQQQVYTLRDLELASQFKGDALPNNKLDVQLASNALIMNQAKHTLNVKNLQLSALGLKLYSDAQVTQLDKQPRYLVNLSSDSFSFRALAQQLGIKLPASADKDALSKIKLSSKLIGGLESVSVDPLNIQVDDSGLTGHIQVSNFQQPALRYELALDEIDVDRYLPPASQADKKQKTATPGAAAAGASALPVEQLRALDIKGNLNIGQLKVTGVRSQNIQVTTNAKDGVLRLHPLSAEMYQGHYKGDIRLDVRGKTPDFSMNESLANIQIGPLLKDLWGEDRIQGVANLGAKLTARGIEPMDFRKTLNGTAHFEFTDGVVKGINLGAYQRALNAKLDGKPIPQETGPNQTDFANLKGTLQITNGLARNNDLSATLPFARIQGKGFAHLAKEVVDYTLYSKFTSELDIKRGKTYAQIDKPALPVRIKGRLTQPDISVDYEAVIKALAQKKLDEKKAAAKQELEEKRQQKEEELKKKLENKLNDKLKDLFKF
ncbi:MAG: AsmA family protein [Thioalkalispiraceae bacterium]|jgi:AsmA protein